MANNIVQSIALTFKKKMGEEKMSKEEKKKRIISLCFQQMLDAIDADFDFRDNCTDTDLWDIDFNEFDPATYIKTIVDIL